MSRRSKILPYHWMKLTLCSEIFPQHRFTLSNSQVDLHCLLGWQHCSIKNYFLASKEPLFLARLSSPLSHLAAPTIGRSGRKSGVQGTQRGYHVYQSFPSNYKNSQTREIFERQRYSSLFRNSISTNSQQTHPHMEKPSGLIKLNIRWKIQEVKSLSCCRTENTFTHLLP